MKERMGCFVEHVEDDQQNTGCISLPLLASSDTYILQMHVACYIAHTDHAASSNIHIVPYTYHIRCSKVGLVEHKLLRRELCLPAVIIELEKCAQCHQLGHTNLISCFSDST